MLKLIKYDFMKLRTWIIAYGAVTLLMNIAFLVFNKLSESFDADFIINAAGITAVFSVITIISLPIVVFIASITLFSGDISKKSGYMTFMTPYHSAYIIGAKIILSLILIFCAAVLICAFVLIDLWVVSAGSDEYSILGVLHSFFDVLDENYLNLALMVISAISQWLSNLIIIYFCITLSYVITRKSKLNGILAFLIWIAADVVISQITSLGAYIFDKASISVNLESDLTLSMETFAGTFIFAIIINLAFSAGFFVLTSWLTEKKMSF